VRGPERTSGAKSPTNMAVGPCRGCMGRKRDSSGRRSQPWGPRRRR
jgi:hypothetical protein